MTVVPIQIPRVGMMASVRGRFGMFQSVSAFDTDLEGGIAPNLVMALK